MTSWTRPSALASLALATVPSTQRPSRVSPIPGAPLPLNPDSVAPSETVAPMQLPLPGGMLKGPPFVAKRQPCRPAVARTVATPPSMLQLPRPAPGP